MAGLVLTCSGHPREQRRRCQNAKKAWIHRVKPGDDDHYESRCQHAATDFDEPDSRGSRPGMTVKLIMKHLNESEH